MNPSFLNIEACYTFYTVNRLNNFWEDVHFCLQNSNNVDDFAQNFKNCQEPNVIAKFFSANYSRFTSKDYSNCEDLNRNLLVETIDAMCDEIEELRAGLNKINTSNVRNKINYFGKKFDDKSLVECSLIARDYIDALINNE